MSEIQNARDMIDFEALPKAVATRHNLRAIAETSNNTADPLYLAKKGLEEHVLPHLKKAREAEEELRKKFMKTGLGIYDAGKATSNALGEDHELAGSVAKSVGDVHQHLEKYTVLYSSSFVIAKSCADTLTEAAQSLDDISKMFSIGATDTEALVPPLDDIIQKLDEFEM